MNIKKFLTFMLGPDPRAQEILSKLESLDNEIKPVVLQRQITGIHINHCNTYIPYMLKEAEYTTDMIVDELYKDLLNIRFGRPLKTS